MSDDGGRPTLAQLLLAGIGWASMGLEAADELADELAQRVGADRAEMRRAMQDVTASWRREAERLGARRGEATEKTFARLGLVRREEVDDLNLRMAQLEHRLRLLENAGSPDVPL
jgi:polyhydroxyalkanoate synthesis regulator phasin